MLTALLVFHIVVAATLFGAPLGLSRNIRKSIKTGHPAVKLVAADGAVRAKIAAIAATLTLLTGIGLIFMKGGFGAVNKSYHIAMTLQIAIMGVGIGIMRPAVRKIEGAIQVDSFNADDVRAAGKKIAMGSGIIHLLWLIILITMVNPF